MTLVQRILNRDKAAQGDTVWLRCCWDDCERFAVSLHRSRHHDHNPGTPCDMPGAKHPWYTFCSERHRQMFLNGHRDYGNGSSGNRSLIS